ncbi:MATE family efflux transporter [Ectobacillus antri]|jgi:putative MATE family efflux protein|uniref:MATE family efflux transporter n=1 Tax=Ectobacillus antri TaxID=2486280 RepID=A0ABT6H3L4_9BACI|nr:MATE family efflux transporter [Ectobacillus antri]MDG4656690.1 MATE family efflux transporter [Ectobacillus antri]MDG5753947.1 MATE family efflux transporter [Ectobacillus antri]
MTKKKQLSLFVITWPIFIEVLLYMLMGNADTLMLSQYSDESVAAVGVANQVLNIVIVMFGFVTAGTAVLIAQHIGAKEEITAKEVAVISLAANAAFGFLISLVVFIFTTPILQAMGLNADLMPRAEAFMQIVGSFSFVQALIMTVGAVLRSNGYTRDTMFVTIAMNILNVIGNYFVIFGPFGFPILGEAGVAWSTTISRIIGLGIVTYLLFRRVGNLFRAVSLFSLPTQHLRNLLKIGVPAAGEHVSYNTSQILITYFITMLGTQALTTKVYAQNITMFIFLFGVAIAQGLQIIVGQHVGARRMEEAYKSCLHALRITLIIVMVTAALFSAFREQLFSLFTQNQSIITTGSTLILLTLILEPGRAFNLIIISALRAAGDVKFPVYMGIASMWGISVPIAYILGIHFELGLVGVWIAFIADEWLRGICMLIRWRSRIWQTKSFVNTSQTAS